jgi:endonuclease YncB( thermonuclease family)
MLKEGMAWWYRDYSKNKHLGAVEEAARRARRGLWSDPNPVPPWVFRRKDR